MPNQPSKMTPRWSAHPFNYGLVCHCGYHGKTHHGREVHNRRAARGLGCKPLEKELMAPTHQAAIDRLKKDGQVKWKDTTGVESRAFTALVKKGLVQEVFQPYGNTYFKLPE